MEAQEIFDTVARHLLTQKKRSKRRIKFLDGTYRESCVYRDAYGRKCAAGIMISDEEYRESMESNPIAEVITAYHLDHLKDHKDLLMQLQYVHDTSEPTEWRAKLHGIAFSRLFNTDVLKEFE